MIITTKGRYALRVMADLAEADESEFIPLKSIASKEGISLKYMESIMAILSKGKMVESASGKGGGYRLIKPAKEYTIGEILRLTEGNIAAVNCQVMEGKDCVNSKKCHTFPFWQGLSDTINNYLDSHTLDELIHG